MTQINQLILTLTSQCSHRCKYCFDRQNYPLKDIEYSAKQIKDFLDNNQGILENPLEVIIQGGDLLLAKNLEEIIQMLIEYPWNIKFRFYFCTLPIKTFLKFPILFHSKIGISCDGPRHVHDLNRKRTDGKSSFDEIEYLIHNNHWLPDVLFMGVITNNNVKYFEESFNFFVGHNLRFTFTVDRRQDYWTSEGIKKLSEIKYPVWGSDQSLLSEWVRENTNRRIMIFSDGGIYFFSNEFAPSHKLVALGNLIDDNKVEEKFQKAYQELKICETTCNNCLIPCKSFSKLSGQVNMEFGLPIPDILGDSHIRHLDLNTHQEIFANNLYPGVLTYDTRLQSDLIIGGPLKHVYPG